MFVSFPRIQITFPSLFFSQHIPLLKSTFPFVSSKQLRDRRQFGASGMYKVLRSWWVNVFPLNSNFRLTVPRPFTGVPSPTPFKVSLTAWNLVKASQMVQMWEVVPESSNQSYLEISWEWLNGEVVYAQLFRSAFTSSAWSALFPFLCPFLPFGPCPFFPLPFAQQSPLTCPFLWQLKHSWSLFRLSLPNFPLDFPCAWSAVPQDSPLQAFRWQSSSKSITMSLCDVTLNLFQREMLYNCPRIPGVRWAESWQIIARARLADRL